jgi:Protein of unknown function (DUF3551)
MRALKRFVVGAAVAVTAGTASAADGSWCAIYTRGSENCGYSSYAQCLATVRGLSASCQPNPFPGTNFGRGGTWGAQGRAPGRYRRDWRGQ